MPLDRLSRRAKVVAASECPWLRLFALERGIGRGAPIFRRVAPKGAAGHAAVPANPSGQVPRLPKIEQTSTDLLNEGGSWVARASYLLQPRVMLAGVVAPSNM